MLINVFIIISLFYFFAILQSSFFVHFNLFGAMPNFVFILYFLVLFFSQKRLNYLTIAYAVIAGLLLDLMFYKFLGLSMVLLLIAGYVAKKIQISLRERDGKYPFFYFLPLFSACLIFYQVAIAIYLRFFDSSHTALSFDIGTLLGIIYNLFFASIGFWIFKKITAHVKKL